MPARPDRDVVSCAERQQSQIRIDKPLTRDGAELWRLARDSGGLDLNSPYSYLLWCRDFSGTSVVARDGQAVVGFITGYRRPDAEDVLFIWQVAVDPAYRGRHIGVRMLDAIATVASRLGCRYIEATVTPDNTASARMFSSFARAHGVPLHRTKEFGAEMFPDNHRPEDLIRIGPL